MRKYLILIITSLIVIFISCYKAKIPIPEKITVIKNGEIIKAARNTREYTLAGDKITGALAQTLVYRKNEKFTLEQVEAMFSNAMNAYKMSYNLITNMKILMPGYYTEKINFKTLYIIYKVDVRYVFFIVGSENEVSPYIPLQDVPELPNN